MKQEARAIEGRRSKPHEHAMGHSDRQFVGAGSCTDNRDVTALTIGVTTARDPACKRGLAVNLAASLARTSGAASRVCVVDADPLTLDVTTRLAVRGPISRTSPDGRAPRLPGSRRSPRWASRRCGCCRARAAGWGGPTGRRSRARRVARHVSTWWSATWSAGRRARPASLSDRLEQLDWLLLAVTPEIEPVEAAARFLEQFETRPRPRRRRRLGAPGRRHDR